MKRFGHALFHVGAVVVQVAATAGWLVPFPFNVAVVGGVAAVQGIVAIKHHTAAPAQ